MKEKVLLALKRALWTAGEAALAFYTAGMAITDVDWKQAASVTAAAFIFSFIKSLLVGMPEHDVATVLLDEEVDLDTEDTDDGMEQEE